MKPTYIGFLFLPCVYATSGNWWGPPVHEEEVIQLGLHFVYDKAFSERALFKVNDSFDAYFTVLTRAAQEYFKLHDDPKIRLTLVGSSKLQREDIITSTTISGTDKLQANDTLDKLGAIMTWNETLARDVDIVFLATGKELHIQESWRSGEWYGLSSPRSICFGNASVGLIHDDGATFNGVRLTALQVALLVGAKKDNGKWGECRKDENQYLTSSARGGRRPALSDCSRESIRDFYYRVINYPNLCWKDTPQPALDPEHNEFPVDFYKKFGCDACHVSEHLKNKSKGHLNCLRYQSQASV
ncbi:uncharacterized protein LOC142559811 [Dermacentor variabilis]|uniref:uncharacterized protein LOC142559811 n=1 Tax=Dermacentor variabilis TaxID=34621 RepID=UPI003F5C3AA0